MAFSWDELPTDESGGGVAVAPEPAPTSSFSWDDLPVAEKPVKAPKAKEFKWDDLPVEPVKAEPLPKPFKQAAAPDEKLPTFGNLQTELDVDFLQRFKDPENAPTHRELKDRLADGTLSPDAGIMALREQFVRKIPKGGGPAELVSKSQMDDTGEYFKIPVPTSFADDEERKHFMAYGVLDPELMKAPGQRMNEAEVAEWKKGRSWTEKIPGKLPFAGAVYDAAGLWRAKDAMESIENGNADKEDYSVAAKFKADIQRDKEMGMGDRILDMAASIPGYGLEFLATGGIYTGTKLAAAQALRRGVKEGAETGLRKAIVGVGSRAAGVTAQSLAMPQQTLKSFVEKSMENPDEDFIKTAAKAFALTGIEVGSERTGGIPAMIPLGGGKTLGDLKAGVMARWFKNHPTASQADFKKLLNRAGWHNPLGEIFEEEVGKAARAGLRIEDYKRTTFEELLTEGAAFSLPGAAYAGLGKLDSLRGMPSEGLPDSLKITGNLPVSSQPAVDDQGKPLQLRPGLGSIPLDVDIDDQGKIVPRLALQPPAPVPQAPPVGQQAVTQPVQPPAQQAPVADTPEVVAAKAVKDHIENKRVPGQTVDVAYDAAGNPTITTSWPKDPTNLAGERVTGQPLQKKDSDALAPLYKQPEAAPEPSDEEIEGQIRQDAMDREDEDNLKDIAEGRGATVESGKRMREKGWLETDPETKKPILTKLGIDAAKAVYDKEGRRMPPLLPPSEYKAKLTQQAEAAKAPQPTAIKPQAVATPSEAPAGAVTPSKEATGAPGQTGVVDTIAGKMGLTEFEKKGYAPEQVTRQNWIDLQRAERRRLGQSEESGTDAAPFADYEVYHEAAVKAALAKGEAVDPEVLKDYPKLTAQPPTGAGVRQPWEMTQSEWFKANIDKYPLPEAGQNRKATLNKAAEPHRTSIERAISEGKPIPAEVLADYPDLAKQAVAKPEPAQPPAKPAPTPAVTAKPVSAAQNLKNIHEAFDKAGMTIKKMPVITLFYDLLRNIARVSPQRMAALKVIVQHSSKTGNPMNASAPAFFIPDTRTMVVHQDILLAANNPNDPILILLEESFHFVEDLLTDSQKTEIRKIWQSLSEPEKKTFRENYLKGWKNKPPILSEKEWAGEWFAQQGIESMRKGVPINDAIRGNKSLWDGIRKIIRQMFGTLLKTIEGRYGKTELHEGVQKILAAFLGKPEAAAPAVAPVAVAAKTPEVKATQARGPPGAMSVFDALDKGLPVKLPTGANAVAVADAKGKIARVLVKDLSVLKGAGPFTKAIPIVVKMGTVKGAGGALAPQWQGAVRVKGEITVKETAPITDSHIGRTWNSRFGKQVIVGVDAGGMEKMYRVKPEGKDEVRIYGAREIEERIKRDEYEMTPEYAKERIDQQEKSKARQVQEQTEQDRKSKDLADIAGFTQSDSPMVAGRKRDTLLRQASFNGKISSRKEFIESSVSDGYTIKAGKAGREFTSPSGTFFDESAITSAGMDYAEYLMKQKEVAPVAAQAKPAPSPAVEAKGNPKVGEPFARLGDYEFGLTKGGLPERPEMYGVGIRRAGSTRGFENGGYPFHMKAEGAIEHWARNEAERGGAASASFTHPKAEEIYRAEMDRVAAQKAKEESDQAVKQSADEKKRNDWNAYQQAIQAVELPKGKNISISVPSKSGEKISLNGTAYGDWLLHKSESKYNESPYRVTHIKSGLGISSGGFATARQAKDYIRALIHGKVKTDWVKQEVFFRDKKELEKLKQINGAWTSGGDVPDYFKPTALVAAPGELGTTYFSAPITSEQDRAYLALAAKYEAGDKSVETELQMMVDEAAKKAGYGTSAFYGFTGNPFRVFDTGNKTAHFSSEWSVANQYAKGYYGTRKGTTGKFYLDLGKTADLRNPDDVNALAENGILIDDELLHDPERLAQEVDAIREAGFDSVTTEHQISMGIGDGTNEYIIFNPSQIKSADAITRTSRERTIPLSERFNPEKESILFATPITERSIENPVGDEPPIYFPPEGEQGEPPPSERKKSKALRAIKASKEFAEANPEISAWLNAEPYYYVPETEQGRREWADRFIKMFGDDPYAAAREVLNPDNAVAGSLQTSILRELVKRAKMRGDLAFEKHLYQTLLEKGSSTGQHLQAFAEVAAEFSPEFQQARAEEAFRSKQEGLEKQIPDDAVGAVRTGVQQAGQEAVAKLEAEIKALEAKIRGLQAKVPTPPQAEDFPIIENYIREMAVFAARLIRQKGGKGVLKGPALPALMQKVAGEVNRQLTAAFKIAKTTPAKLSPAQRMRIELETIEVAEKAYNATVEEVRVKTPGAVPAKIARFDRNAPFRHAIPAIQQALREMGHTQTSLRKLFEEGTDWHKLNQDITNRVAEASGSPGNQVIRNAASAAADNYLDGLYKSFREKMSPPLREAYEEAASQRFLAGVTAKVKDAVQKPALEAFYLRLTAAVTRRYRESLPRSQKAPADPLQAIQGAMAELFQNRDKFNSVVARVLEEAKDMSPEEVEKIKAAFADEWQGMSDKQAARSISLAVKDLGLVLKEILQGSLTDQIAARKAIYERILNHPALQGLSGEDAQQVADALGKAWEAKRNAIFRTEFARLVPLPNLGSRAVNKVKNSIPRLVKLANLEMLDNEAFYNAVAPEFGLPEFTPEISDTIYRLAQDMQKMPKGRLRERAMRQMLDYIALKAGLSKWEMLSSYWYGSILSGLGTQSVNLFATAANIATVLAIRSANAPRAAPGMVVRYAEALAAAFATDWKTIVKEGELPKRMNQEVKEASGAMELAGRLSLKTNPIAKLFSNIKYVTRFMAFNDSLQTAQAREIEAYYLAYQDAKEEGIPADKVKEHIHALLKLRPGDREKAITQAQTELAQGLMRREDMQWRVAEILRQERPNELMKEANMLAVTHAMNRPLSESGTILGMFFNHLIPALEKAPAARLWVPFITVPVNVTNLYLDFTPVALFRLAQQTGQARHGKAFKQMTPAEIQLLRGKILFQGLFALSVIAALAAQPDDPDERWFDIHGGWKDLDKKARDDLMGTGRKRYSIRIGKHSFSYQYWPMAILLASIGNHSDTMRYGKGKAMKAHDVFASDMLRAVQVTADMAAMAKVMESMNYLSHGDVDGAANHIKKFVGDAAGGLVPNLLKEFDTYRDPQVYTPTEIWHYFQKHIPIARSDIGRPKINLLGEVIEITRHPLLRFYSSSEVGPVWREIGKKADKGVFMTSLGEKSKELPNGDRIPMTDEEDYDYKLAVGKATKVLLEEAIASGEFQRMNPVETARWYEKEFKRVRSRVAVDMGFEIPPPVRLKPIYGK